MQLSRSEIAERGEEIFAQQIRANLPADAVGKFVVLDIDSGEYEIDADDLAASNRLLARQPHAVLYGLKIGSSAAYRLR